MTEPSFAVPLDKLMIVRSFAGTDWSWRCGIGTGSRIDPGWVSGACRYDHTVASESEAELAAIAHLATEHSIAPVGGRLSSDRLAQFLRLNYVPGTTKVPWGAEDEELRVAWLEEAAVIIDKVLGVDR